MDNLQKVEYYRKQCVSLMNIFEAKTGQLMNEHSTTTSDLEKAVWNAADEKDHRRLFRLHLLLCKLVDNLEMDWKQ